MLFYYALCLYHPLIDFTIDKLNMNIAVLIQAEKTTVQGAALVRNN